MPPIDPPPPPRPPAPCVVRTRLEDDTPVCIRTITPADEALMRAGIERMSPRSRYLRFFSGAKTPPDWVIDRLLDADGHRHLAWGALRLDSIDGPASGETAIGAVHAFRDKDDPDCAEFSVAILDDWHGLGLGKLLTATILLDAQAQGIDAFHVDTLAENRSAIDFTRSLGGRPIGQQGTAYSYTLDVAEALQRLREENDPPGIAAVFGVLGGQREPVA